MKKEQVFKEFNEKGIFPSDAVLNEIAKSYPNEYDHLGDVEFELVMIAFNDSNHPYHSMVSTPVFAINIEDLSIIDIPHKAPIDSSKMCSSYID